MDSLLKKNIWEQNKSKNVIKIIFKSKCMFSCFNLFDMATKRNTVTRNLHERQGYIELSPLGFRVFHLVPKSRNHDKQRMSLSCFRLVVFREFATPSSEIQYGRHEPPYVI